MQNKIIIICIILVSIVIFYIITKEREFFYVNKNKYLRYDNFLNNHQKITNEIELPRHNKYRHFKDTFQRFFIINLPKTKIGTMRWNRIQQNKFLHNYAERYRGINGRLYNFKNEINNGIINRNWNWGKWKHNKNRIIPLSKPEMGVALSHLRIWLKIALENIPSTLILEDDAIRLSQDFDKVVVNTFNYVPNDWDIILIGFDNYTKIPDIKINNYIWKVKNFVLLHSYYISIRGAKKLLSYLPISAPVDTWISCISDKLNIYRHNELLKPRVYSRIIR